MMCLEAENTNLKKKAKIDLEAELRDMTIKFYKTEEFNSQLRLKLESYHKQMESMRSGTESKFSDHSSFTERPTFYKSTLDVPYALPSIIITPSKEEINDSSEERSQNSHLIHDLRRSYYKSRFIKSRQEHRERIKTKPTSEQRGLDYINY